MDYSDFLRDSNKEDEFYYYNDGTYQDHYNISFTPKYSTNEEFMDNFMKIGNLEDNNSKTIG